MASFNLDGMDLNDIATYGYRSDRWNFVEGEAVVGIIAKLNKDQNRYIINPATSRVVWRMLTFYPGATLLRVTDLSWRPMGLTTYYIGLKGDYRRVDGTRRFISFLNEKMPLKLSAATVVDYLRFYSFFVRYKGRPFLLVEKPEDLGLFEPELTPLQQRAAEAALRPVEVQKDGTDGSPYELSAIVRYANALFECRFEVSQNGVVKMLSERDLGLDLPALKLPLAAPAWDAA